MADLMAVLLGEDTTNVPALAREALRGLAAELEALDRRMKEIEVAIVRWHKDNEASRRLAAIPGVGPITASAIVATISDPFQFHSARHLAAWIGLVPRQHSSGGKPRQGGISKQGDRYLRRLLVPGATAVIRHALRPTVCAGRWSGESLSSARVRAHPIVASPGKVDTGLCVFRLCLLWG